MPRDAQRLGHPPIGIIMRRTQLRHIAIEQPVQQCAAFTAAQRISIGLQRFLQRTPIVYGCTDMRQIGRDIIKQSAPTLCIGPIGLEVNQRGRAADINDGMQDTVGRNVMRGHCCRD